MAKNWKIVARDTFGNETLLSFCNDMQEGKQMLALLQAEQTKNGFEGVVALTAVYPDWLPEPTTDDYKHYVRSLIPEDEWINVTKINDVKERYKLELGRMNEYYLLAKIIPKSFNIIDFGCSSNAQSYLFTNHKSYIAVDTQKAMFRAPGTQYFKMTTGQFIKEELTNLKLNIQKTFAICANVTGKNNENPGMLVRMNFLNMFTINNFKNISSNENSKDNK